MDIIMFLNILVTLVISTIFMIEYQKRAIEMIESIFKNEDSNETNVTESIQNNQLHIIATSRLIIICGIVLTIGFTGLYIFQSKSDYYPPYIQTCISSGLYVPIFLFVIGFMINQLYKSYVKKSSNFSLSTFEIKNTVFIMSIIVNVPLITLDWHLGLFVIAIILGKFIWIDFVFDTKSIVTSILNTFKKNGDVGVESLCFQYATYFYPTFFMVTITYQLFIKDITDISEKICIMILIYIIDIRMYISYLNGIDNVNTNFKKKK